MEKGNENQAFSLDVLKGVSSLKDDSFPQDFFTDIESIEEIQNTEINKNNNISEKKNEENKEDNLEESEDSIEEIESIEDLNTKKNSNNKEEKPKVAETKIEKSNNQNDTKRIEKYSAFAEDLKEEGLIDFDKSDFDKSEDKIDYLRNKIAEKSVKIAQELFNEKLGELPEEIEELVELHKKGVPLHSILESNKKIEEYESIKTENLTEDIDLQKKLIRDLLETQGLSKERISTKIKRYEELGTLKDESEEALDTLKIYEKESKEELIREEISKTQKAKQDFEKRIKQIEDTINSKNDILGLPISKEQKKQLIDGILKPVGKTNDGRAYNLIQKAKMEDPEYDLKHAYFDIILKRDLSKIDIKKQTQIVKNIQKLIEDSEDLITGGETGEEDNNTSKTDINVIKSAVAYLRKKNNN